MLCGICKRKVRWYRLSVMSNKEVALLLRKVATAYTLTGENRFKVIAYEKAATNIEQSPVEVETLWKEGKLGEIGGIGTSIAGYLKELFTKGNVAHFSTILKSVPPAVFALMDVPGIGAKRALQLVHTLHLSNEKKAIDDLFAAAKMGKIADMEGFGEKSQQDIIEAIGRFRTGSVKEKKMPLAFAYSLADTILSYMKRQKDTVTVVPLGSLRRMVETIGDIDIVVQTHNPEAAVEWFLKYPDNMHMVEKGPRGATILLKNGKQIDMRVCEPSQYGAMLQYFTGSKNHNITLREYALRHGLSLNEYGIKIADPKKKHTKEFPGKGVYDKKRKLYEYKTEEDFYRALGLRWIPPEIREDHGEIDASLRSAQGKRNGLPNLVKFSDIKGDFHIHSNYPIEPSHDLGSSSIRDIAKRASELGYAYIGISDHNPSIMNHTEDRIIAIMKKRKEHIDKINYSIKSTRVHIFSMMEIDILPSGEVAIPTEAFAYLDAAIVSVHSSFRMNKEAMTKRVLRGMSHPKVKLLGHPTGRLIGKREPYELDWQEVFSYCKSHGKGLEINSYPDRLDLSDRLSRQAIEAGVLLAINTDSHAAEQMEMMRFGVAVARRGWATPDDIINTWEYESVKKWLNG